MNAVEILMGESHGVHVPAAFVECFIIEQWGLERDSWEIETILKGPEHEHYWDAWNYVLDTAAFRDRGATWRLYQDGDLWAVCPELMTDEEKANFGWED